MALSEAQRTAVVKVATELFWRDGYDDTSIADIVAATGVNRYAIYSDFGGKRDLFLAALQNYYNECAAIYIPIVYNEGKSALSRVREMLEVYRDELSRKHEGCLMAQVAVSMARSDVKIQEDVTNYFALILEHMSAPLREAAEQGALNPNLTPEAAAQIVFDAKMSMNLLARAACDADALGRVIDATMDAVRAPGAIVN